MGEVAIDHMNMLTLTLPGIAVTYQGEEIGMLNNFDITWDQTVDPSGACPYNMLPLTLLGKLTGKQDAIVALTTIKPKSVRGTRSEPRFNGMPPTMPDFPIPESRRGCQSTQTI